MKRRPADKRDAYDLTDLRAFMYYRVSRDSSGEEKSVKDQAAEGHQWAERSEVRIVGEYEDVSLSASQFARKERPGYKQLLAAIADGGADLLWIWALNRATRQAREYLDLAELCEAQGVRWVIGGKVYDLGDDDDTIGLDLHNLMDKRFSKKLSKDVSRGKKFSAGSGRRAGQVPYGYRARYASDGQYLHDEPDLFDGDGVAIEDTPAYVVREIYDRLLAGHSLTSIRRDLNDRGIRTKRGYTWENSTVRFIAMSPTYLGQRVYQVGEGILQADRVKTVLDGVDTKWPPLVAPETFWAVHRLLSDPARKTTRNGRRSTTTLLSSIARCAECGGKLIQKKMPANSARTTFVEGYTCKEKACVGIGAKPLDEYVKKVVVAYLSRRDVAEDLTRSGDSAAAARARGDLEQLRAELAALYRDAEAGEVSPVMATTAEKGLQQRISEAAQRVQDATLPPVLRGKIGKQAADGWEDSTLEGRRELIRAVADVRVHRVGRGHAKGGGAFKAEDRVSVDPRVGPDRQTATDMDRVLGGRS